MTHTKPATYRLPTRRSLSKALAPLLLATAALLASGAACAGEGNDSVAVVNKYLATWNSGNAEALSQVLDPRVQYFNTSNGAVLTGPENIALVSQFLKTVLPDRKLSIRSAPVVAGDRVAIEWVLEASAPKDAKDPLSKISFQGASIFQVKDGRILYASDYYNSETMKSQLGL